MLYEIEHDNDISPEKIETDINYITHIEKPYPLPTLQSISASNIARNHMIPDRPKKPSRKKSLS